MKAHTFAHGIDSILQDNRKDRYVSNMKKGKLNMKSVYKIAHSNRLFKQRHARLNKDYYFTFYLDCSGSMEASVSMEIEGIKYNMPRYLAMAISVADLHDTLKKIKGLHIRVILFSTGSLLVKDYDQDISYDDLLLATCKAFSLNSLKRYFKNKYDQAPTEIEDIVNKSRENNFNDYTPYLKKTLLQEDDRTKSSSLIYSKIPIKGHDAVAPDEYHNFGNGGTQIYEAIVNFPSNHDNEVSIIFSDGEFDRLDDLRRLLPRQKGIFFGVGMQSTAIFDAFGIAKAMYVENMSQLYGLLLSKMKSYIHRG